MPDDPRVLLKQATALKRQKRYAEAVEALQRAMALPTPPNGCPLMIEERLRLPMYLQLAGRDDEGWREIDALEVRYPDGFSQARIAAQRVVFMRKCGDSAEALVYSAYAICQQHICDIGTITSMVHGADEAPARAVEWKELGLPPWEQSLPVSGTTPAGNPIFDTGYKIIRDRVYGGYSMEELRAKFGRNLKKVVGDRADAFLLDFMQFLQGGGPYALASVRRLLAQYR